MGMGLDRTIRLVRKVNGEVDSILAEMFREHKTFDWALEQRNKRVFQHPVWKSLPRWAQTEVQGRFDGGQQLIQNTQLLWTLVLDGERLCSKIPDHRKKMDGHWDKIDQQNRTPREPTDEWLEQNGERGMHCYLVDGKWLPFRGPDRKAEEVRLAALGN